MIKRTENNDKFTSEKRFQEYLDKYNRLIKENPKDPDYLLDKAKYLYFYLKKNKHMDLERESQIISEILSTIGRSILLDPGLCTYFEDFNFKHILEES